MINLFLFVVLSCHKPVVPEAKVFESLRLVAGSCNQQTKSQSHWTLLDAEEADYYLALGDNVYADRRVSGPDGYIFETSLEQLVKAYETQSNHAPFKAFQENTPVIPTWDDHDYGLNDAGAELGFADASQQEFLKFWGVPKNDSRWTRKGIYTSETLQVGSLAIQIIVLDTRRFRSPLLSLEQPNRAPYGSDTDSRKTMLGAIQWQWLEIELEKNADYRILMSSIQVLADSHIYERWGTLPNERWKLLELLDASGPTLIVSGDRHLGAIYHDAERPLIWELTTSSLNASFGATEESDPHRIGEFSGATNFGRIDVMNNEVRFSLVNLDGKIVASQLVKVD